jgi:hypothetical protein
MDEAYWRERCTAAEAALVKARTAITLTKTRRAILSALGDLRQGEWLETERVGAILYAQIDNTLRVLNDLELFGLVERAPGRRGGRGAPLRWRLGHLVQVAVDEDETTELPEVIE